MAAVSRTAEKILDSLAEKIATHAVVPLLISQQDVPAFLGISRANFFKLKSAGLLPAPVSLCGETKYRRLELEKWVTQLSHARPGRRPKAGAS